MPKNLHKIAYQILFAYTCSTVLLLSKERMKNTIVT